MTIRVSVEARNAGLDAAFDRVDAGAGPGTLKLYTGNQPSNSASAATGTHLATFTLADTAFLAADNGVKTLDVSGGIEAAGIGAGTGGWARVADSNGVTVFDGSVGTMNADFTINTTSVAVSQTIVLTGGSISDPA